MTSRHCNFILACWKTVIKTISLESRDRVVSPCAAAYAECLDLSSLIGGSHKQTPNGEDVPYLQRTKREEFLTHNKVF